MDWMIWSLYRDNARWINMVMLIACVAALTANMIVRRNNIPRRARRITAWVYALLINVVYGYSISIQEHRHFNWSVGLGTILLVGTLASILWHPPGDNKPPPYDGALTSRFMFWLDGKVRRYKTRHHIGGD